MPQPPVRNFSFTNWSQNNPTTPQPGNNLDSNYDLTNSSVGQVITWCNVSLNTDGTLRDGSVKQSTLVAGLFDGISQDIINEVQPLVTEAQGYAQNALTSQNAAASSASSAASNASNAAGSASNANASAQSASGSQAAAQTSASQALNSSTTASNAANTATGAQAQCNDYALVTQAWAEYMPGPIPPNILAYMGVTGSHWSARWWANNANQIVSGALGPINDAVNNGLQQIQQAQDSATAAINTAVNNGIAQINASVKTWYLGALPNDPAPVVPPPITGCLYFNTTLNELMVFNGTAWQPAMGSSVTGPSMQMVKLDVGSWAPNGSTVSFPMVNPSGTALVPQAAEDVLFSEDGVWLEAEKDFTLNGSNLVFTRAPANDSNLFGVVSLPA